MVSKAKTPEDIPALFVEAWNQRDARQIANLFEEEAEFVNVIGLWWHTRNQIEKAHDYGLKVIFNTSEALLQKTKTTWLSSDIAVVHAKMMMRNQTAKDEIINPAIRQTIFSFVVRRIDDHWMCRSAQNTDIVPGAETNIISEDGSMKSVSYRS